MAGKKFTVILTHEHTDFDGLASMLAAHKLHPHAIPVLPRCLNRNLQEFLALYRSALPFRRQEDLPRRQVDYAIVVDTQTYSTVKGMKPDTPGQIVDHHVQQRTPDQGWTFDGEEVGATTTLLVEKIARRQIEVSPVEATLLLLGIYEDTGSLVYIATTARDLQAAAWLIEQGANLQVVGRFLHHPLTPEQLDLYTALTESNRVYDIAGHSVVVASASAPGFGDEISTLAHKIRDVYEPSGLFLIVDLGDRIQVVARSATDAVDVGSIALKMGGGGHPRAAAALVRGKSLTEVEVTLLSLLQESVKPLVTVEKIMTHGYPATVPPSTTIEEMVGILQRYGFEGYPVVEETSSDENGKRSAHVNGLLGNITRRQVDRAVQHGLATHTVNRYMRTGRVTVTPEAGINELQKLMIESGWGQIPVIDPTSEMIIGIVTRTDLIKLWGEPDKSSRREEIALRMETALPDALLALLRLAGQSANELGFPLYAVGGFARDLLLDRPNFDVDLVVEGDAIALARRLARRHGGRVRSHKRFGTAKWILPESGDESGSADDPDALIVALNHILAPPAALDFVTARTEFYAEPTVLPAVEHGSIKLDLHRRDFTINTLAVSLNPDRWGELLDFYGGERDLNDGLIRVLHTHSFVDDPTRILRAVRFEQRFGFQIEQRTGELIQDSLDLLDRISPARVRHELELILAEALPEQSLARLEELGVISHIHPALTTDSWVVDRFRRFRESRRSSDLDAETDQLYFAIWTYRLPREELTALDKRLTLMRSSMALLENLHDFKAQVQALENENLSRSQAYRLLKPTLAASRFLMRIISDSQVVRWWIDLYEGELMKVKPYLGGEDLMALGLRPGPAFKKILDTARDAWLDGSVTSEAEERALVKALAESQ